MGIPERTADYLARELALDIDKKSIILYSSRIIYSTLLSLIAIIVASYLMGVLNYALVAVATNAVLRNFAGGVHASTPARCALIGTVVFTGCGLITKYFSWPSESYIQVIITVVGLMVLVAIWRYAPADTPNRPIRDKDFIIKLRRRSLIVMFLWSALVFVFVTGGTSSYFKALIASTLGLVWESFTLTTVGYRFIGFLDLIMTRLTRGRRE